jgi:hypothetical protein
VRDGAEETRGDVAPVESRGQANADFRVRSTRMALPDPGHGELAYRAGQSPRLGQPCRGRLGAKELVVAGVRGRSRIQGH